MVKPRYFYFKFWTFQDKILFLIKSDFYWFYFISLVSDYKQSGFINLNKNQKDYTDKMYAKIAILTAMICTRNKLDGDKMCSLLEIGEQADEHMDPEMRISHSYNAPFLSLLDISMLQSDESR